MRSRTATAVAAIVGMLAVAVVTVFFELLAMGLGTCGGDGGSPFAARDSAQGHVCDFLDRGGMTLVMAVEIAALVAAGVVIALWARRRAGGRLAVACAVAASLLPLAGLWALSAPSDNCSKADQAAYQGWLDRGASGAPPAGGLRQLLIHAAPQARAAFRTFLGGITTRRQWRRSSRSA